MEITIEDLKFFKLSPSLIFLIKAIYIKDDDLISELDNIVGINQMCKHLEDKMILKIVSNEIKSSSFEIRNLEVLRYLSEGKKDNTSLAKEIFDHYVLNVENYGGKKSNIKFNTFKDFLKKRINAGVDVDNAKAIINMKFKEWYYTDSRRHLNFQTLLGSTHYGQYVQQLTIVEDNSEDLTRIKA